MALMPLTLEWTDVGVRLALAALAGVLIGLNRGESGKVAGLRTTLLVCLAACLAMLQANALLAQSGKTPGSFATLDLMRLPLGILSGVGFIGAGAILRKDGLVKGVTTAATLWFVTVVGLCFGGGQLGLGVLGLVLGIVVLWFLKAVEARIPRENEAELRITYRRGRFSREALVDAMRASGCRLTIVAGSTKGRMPASVQGEHVEERFEVRWHGPPDVGITPPFNESAIAAGACESEWTIVR
ncbi:MgtC/SapB transporter [Caballeronia hypogeia]|uniref:Protein MgtC n=1 Tax=Caballeronia hypogeia TaxID=1777140 RepID=A0A158AFK6_9BURK|nr:MgtC/SapB family protein [Caballeronia hypogeia]SAK55847.1 MgtC/SapB transporter [Caballeronia hypogeia]